MKRNLLGLIALGGSLLFGEAPQSFTGVITDTMCGPKHTMGISPDEKCVRECVRMDPKKWKYGLLVGKDVYVLGDQETPAKFAGQKVKVTGTLFAKTKILKVAKIEAVR